jgi:hypothetical protein
VTILSHLKSLWRSGVVETANTPDGLGRWKVDRNFIDLRAVTDDPLEARYRAGEKPALVHVQLASVLNLGPLAFSVTAHSDDPYVRAARDHIDGCCDRYRGSRLEWFYARWRPQSAAAVLGLEEADAPRALLSAPAHAAVFPWDGYTPSEMDARKREGIERENRKHGAELSIADGFKWVGPLSARNGGLEYRRLRVIIDSVARHGYQEIIGSPRGRLMMRGAEWRVLGTGGDHRRAVRVALGWSHVPMRLVGAIVRREDVGSWPNVRNELFTQAQALNVFDRIFEGRQPAGCPVWQTPAPLSDTGS